MYYPHREIEEKFLRHHHELVIIDRLCRVRIMPLRVTGIYEPFLSQGSNSIGRYT